MHPSGCAQIESTVQMTGHRLISSSSLLHKRILTIGETGASETFASSYLSSALRSEFLSTNTHQMTVPASIKARPMAVTAKGNAH